MDLLQICENNFSLFLCQLISQEFRTFFKGFERMFLRHQVWDDIHCAAL